MGPVRGAYKMEDMSRQSSCPWNGDKMVVPVLNRAAAAWMGAAPRAGGAPAVRLESVGRRYGRGQSEVRALDGVSLEIGDGAFVAVMGPSGSGKSTLLNLIGALDRPRVASSSATAMSRRCPQKKRHATAAARWGSSFSRSICCRA